MNDETFRSRLLLLLQKSRKAVRLYSNVSKQDSTINQDSQSEDHMRQWRDVNSDLSNNLKSLLEEGNGRALTAGAFALRDRFQREFRLTESDLHLQQCELVAAAERSDFLKVVSMARKLVGLKARVQALQAVHHELQTILDKCNVSQSAVKLLETADGVKPVESRLDSENMRARIIPLRLMVNQ